MKKTISLLFALCTLAIAVIPVNAVERHRSIELMRYSNISDVWAGYSEANLIGTCSGYASVSDASTTSMELYLQISYDGGKTYKNCYLVASNQFSGDGERSIFGTKKNLSSDGKYRTALYIKVYNSKGQLIDSAEAYSD